MFPAFRLVAMIYLELTVLVWPFRLSGVGCESHQSDSHEDCIVSVKCKHPSVVLIISCFRCPAVPCFSAYQLRCGKSTV